MVNCSWCSTKCNPLATFPCIGCEGKARETTCNETGGGFHMGHRHCPEGECLVGSVTRDETRKANNFAYRWWSFTAPPLDNKDASE